MFLALPPRDLKERPLDKLAINDHQHKYIIVVGNPLLWTSSDALVEATWNRSSWRSQVDAHCGQGIRYIAKGRLLLDIQPSVRSYMMWNHLNLDTFFHKDFR